MATVTTGADIGGQKNQNKRTRMETKLILPGVFFIYEIYSFALEVFSLFFLLVLMVVIGGVMTVSSWIDSVTLSRERKK